SAGQAGRGGGANAGLGSGSRAGRPEGRCGDCGRQATPRRGSAAAGWARFAVRYGRVTVCVPFTRVQVTVPPGLMFTVAGLKLFPTCPTLTAAFILAALASTTTVPTIPLE